MKRFALILLALAVFLAVLVARLPAAWVVPAFAPALKCTAVHGSVWNGECRDARIRTVRVDLLAWQVHARTLLSGRLSATVRVVRANDAASGELSIGLSGPLHGRDIRIRLRLNPALLPAIPSYISGRIAAHIARITIRRNGVVERLRGRLTVNKLVNSAGHVTPLGSYELTFPGGSGEPVGHLRDLGGPLSLTGTVRLTAQPGYVLHARLAARADADPSLVQALQYLGTPDSAGRRPFALAGTY